jgi:hypothetical protein
MIHNHNGKKYNLVVKKTGVIKLDVPRGDKFFSEEIGTLRKCPTGYVLYVDHKQYNFYGTKKWAVRIALKIYLAKQELNRINTELENKKFKEKIDSFLSKIKFYNVNILTEKTIKEIDAIIENEIVENFICLELKNGVANSEPSLSIHFGFDGREKRVVLGSIGFQPKTFADVERLIESNIKLISLAKTCECLLDTIF